MRQLACISARRPRQSRLHQPARYTLYNGKEELASAFTGHLGNPARRKPDPLTHGARCSLASLRRTVLTCARTQDHIRISSSLTPIFAFPPVQCRNHEQRATVEQTLTDKDGPRPRTTPTFVDGHNPPMNTGEEATRPLQDTDYNLAEAWYARLVRSAPRHHPAPSRRTQRSRSGLDGLSLRGRRVRRRLGGVHRLRLRCRLLVRDRALRRLRS